MIVKIDEGEIILVNFVIFDNEGKGGEVAVIEEGITAGVITKIRICDIVAKVKVIEFFITIGAIRTEMDREARI